MKIKPAIALVGLVAALGAQALEQPAPNAIPAPARPATPEPARTGVPANLEPMLAMMGPMTEIMITAQLTAASKPEVVEKLASFKRNLYEALLKKGFTPEQALQIVVATPLPGASLGGK